MSDMKDRLHTGELYLPGDKEIQKEQLACLDRLHAFNRLLPSQQKEKEALLREMFAEMGEDCYIEAPLYSNFGGRHVHFGSHIYANFGLTLVDDTHIYVGDYVMFAPHVTVVTAAHPILPALREKEYQYNAPVHIGRNCWLGTGTVVLPGVSIGDGSVIGAGSVVTRDIPAGVVAVGSPCRVLREISGRDREFYFRDRKINWEEIFADTGITKE